MSQLCGCLEVILDLTQKKMKKVFLTVRPIISPQMQIRSCCIHEHSQAEQQLNKLLRSGIEGCSRVVVHDVSNGCGSMYEVFVEATSFKGLSKVAQHKMITSLLREEIKDMHGLTIRTKAA
ncbi:unnamed protein product [Caenorhabditis sp. 36 PRJEB53466]|nr:unnamed protein product [Caenorhabditis sp. 36 PRJEB53466]